MNRILLGLICCCPLLLNVSAVQSVELVGPYDDENVIQTTPKPVTRSIARSTAPTTYGPIKSSETLWSIATKLRPNNNVSVYQTIAAIYKFNPNAFLGGDINKIISSSRIRVPSAGFVAQQTDAEAKRLLNPVRKVAAKATPKVVAKPTVKPVVKEEVVKAPVVEPTEVKVPEKNAVDPSILDELKKELEGKEEAITDSKTLLSDQEQELTKLSEQLIVVTEANQRLKLKLQPLSDQIETLSVQVDEDIKTQAELQAIIDEYRKQIEAFEAPPFSGEGMLNAILRSITSSSSVLLLSMLVPLLLLTAIFLFILRLKSKRELDLKEQELAESTSLLSDDDSGDFDEFLSDENEEADNVEVEENVDLDNDEDLIQQVPEVEETIKLDDDIEEVDTDTELIEDDASEDDFKFDNNDKDEIIELSEMDFDVDDDSDQADLDLAAAWEAQINESKSDTDIDIDELAALEDSFGPVVEDIPAEKIDELDDIAPEEIEPEVTADVPETEIAAEQVEEPVEPVVEDIAAEDIPAEKIDELDDIAPEEIEPEVTADAPETEIVAEQVEEPVEPVVEDIAAEDIPAEKIVELDDIAPEEIEPEVTAEAPETEIAAEQVEEPVESVVENIAGEDIPAEKLDELDDIAPEQVEEPVVDDIAPDEIKPESEVKLEVDAEPIEVAEEPVIDEVEPEDTTELPKAPVVDDAAVLDSEVPEKIEPTSEDEITAEPVEEKLEPVVKEVTADAVPDDIDPVVEPITELEETLSDEVEPEEDIVFDFDEADTDYAKSIEKQFNQNAFKEDIELPTIDKNDDKGFIDIDTLLTGTDGAELTEEEFNLDFGLDEFPDVVEFSEFDNDADGVAAQLDLARAYLEIDEKESAKDILNKLVDVAKDGKLKEVQKLLKRIN